MLNPHEGCFLPWCRRARIIMLAFNFHPLISVHMAQALVTSLKIINPDLSHYFFDSCVSSVAFCLKALISTSLLQHVWEEAECSAISLNH